MLRKAHGTPEEAATSSGSNDEDVPSQRSKMLEDDGDPRKGTQRLILTRASGSCSVLIGEVEEDGCDAGTGGLGGGAPLSTDQIDEHL